VKRELQLPCRFTSEADGAILSPYAANKLNKQELGHNVYDFDAKNATVGENNLLCCELFVVLR
jgi:hypothetical protein